jgi:endo-1,4-beta-xylanase
MSKNMAESDRYDLISSSESDRFDLVIPKDHNRLKAEKEISKILERGGHEFETPSVRDVFGALAAFPILALPTIEIVSQLGQNDTPSISQPGLSPEQQSGEESTLTSWDEIPYVRGEPDIGGIAIEFGLVQTDAINFRRTANGEKISTLPAGGYAERISDEIVSAGGYDWVFVKTQDGQTGWIFTGGYTDVPQEEYATLPQEIKDFYTTSAELPASTSELTITKLGGLYRGQSIGGSEELTQALTKAWKSNEVNALPVDPAISSWQRSVASTALDIALNPESKNSDSFDVKLAGASDSFVNSSYVQENGDILIATRLDGEPNLFVVTHFTKNQEVTELDGLNLKATDIGFASYEALVKAYGSESAKSMAENATTITGDTLSFAEKVSELSQAKVFLAGMPEGNRFAPKLEIEGATEVIYNVEENGTYTAYGVFPGQTEITDYVYKSGEWVVELNAQEAIPVETAQIQVSSLETELPALPDLSKYNTTIESYSSAIKLTTDEVLSSVSIGQYKNQEGKPFFVVEHNGNPLLITTINSNTNEIAWIPATPFTIGNATGIEMTTGVVGSFLASWHEESQVMNEVVKPFAGTLLTYDFQMYNQSYSDLSMRPDRNTFNFKNADQKIQLVESMFINKPLHAQNALEFVRSFIPPWAENIADANELKTVAVEHIRSLIARYKGRIDSWVVFGEMYNQWTPNMWVEKLGTSNISWIKDIYDAAHQADPKTELIYSDFDIEFGGDKADMTFETIKRVVESGAPIDAIAFQMHINGRDFTGGQLDFKVAEIRKQIKRYQQLGLEVIVGEMDVMMEGVSIDSFERSQIQASIVKALLKACVEEGVTGIRFFSQIDRLSWKEQVAFAGGSDGDPTLFDDQGNPKPSYYAAMAALLTK